jgi:hypothetical protein
MSDAHPEDSYIMKNEFGMLIDNSEEAFEADPKRKRTTINSVKEDFINHDLLPGSTHNVERLPGKIAIKYNLPPPIANEVAGHIITDSRSVIDMEPIMDTVFIYRKKEE